LSRSSGPRVEWWRYGETEGNEERGYDVSGATLKHEIALYPTSEQIGTLLSCPEDRPVVMVNLLRFKLAADPPDETASGEEAYRRYAEKMVAFIESRGCRVIWSGRIDSQVIGRGGELFQMVALVEYPSRKAFVEIASDPYVQEIAAHRAAGLEGQWLLAATAASP
jgi:uncharacterized protein (DUF1330 family)